jgi:hypothetical protein
MEFKDFNSLLEKHVSRMTKDETNLFTVDCTKDELWELYLESFPKGTNEIFREQREHDCNCCKSFIRHFGNVVAIKDNTVVSIWDFKTNDKTYQPVINKLAKHVKSKKVTEAFVTDIRSLGTSMSAEINENGSLVWYHFHADLPKNIQVVPHDKINYTIGQLRDSRNVLERSIKEISPEAVETVLDLIAQKSLYKGDEWDRPLQIFQKTQKKYLKLRSADKKSLYCWKKSIELGPALSRIRNHSIGVLLTDIAESVDLDTAVKRYEKIVAPTNYKRPKAIFTKKMVAEAQKTAKELGVEESLSRRFAVEEDITINNVLFANREAQRKMSGGAFDELAEEATTVNPKQLSRAEEISAENFFKDVLPKAETLEVLFENAHIPNLVSLIAPKGQSTGKIFKWDNNFSWAYNGNITDSMKERVKAAGGKVDGDLRFSIQWNDDPTRPNKDDLDAHCIEPNNRVEIYYPNKGRRHPSSGMLDVDITSPGNKVAVENIIWSDRRKMPQGVYKLFVHDYNARGASSGFTAEVEFDGQIYSFSYNKPLRHNENIQVAEVTFKDNKFTIKEKLPSSMSSRTEWEIKTGNFVPASMCMYSPNYWDEQQGIGHRHYFFILQGCKNTTTPNGFFNEFLREDLVKHKRVFEALGSKMRVEPADEQLSGIGFSSTKRASVICKVTGSFTRTLKVNF